MGSFSATVKGFAEKSKAAQEAVLQSSMEDVVARASASQESARTRVGAAMPGYFPKDTGHLIATVAADINGSGSFAVDTETDVSLQINEFGAGDKMHVAWTAAYAHRINSGFVGTDSLGRTYEQGGVHAVEATAADWQEIVDANVEFLKV